MGLINDPLIALAMVFAVVVFVLAMKRPLWQAVGCALIAASLLFKLEPIQMVSGFTNVITHWRGGMQLLASFYFITYLQRMLESRRQVKLAHEDLNGLFHNRRVNVIVAPIFIGLMPSAAAMILCGDIVKEATDGYLDPKQQACVTNWFRHVPESSMPTYSSVILMSALAGIPLSQFVPAMVIPVVAAILIPYFIYVRRIPKDPGTPKSTNRMRDAVNLVRHLWSLVATIVLILAFDLDVVLAVLVVIALCIPIYGFGPAELARTIKSAFEPKLLVNTFFVLVLKNYIDASGAMRVLPATLSSLPIPQFVVFAIMFFVGTLISGSAGIIAIGVPIAFSAMPEGGVALMVMLMCTLHAANLLSPTHVCLVVASEYYKVSLGALIRKTVPVSLTFLATMLVYYYLVVHIF